MLMHTDLIHFNSFACYSVYEMLCFWIIQFFSIIRVTNLSVIDYIKILNCHYY